MAQDRGRGKSLDVFLDSLNKLRLRGECNYWQSIADRFPEYVQTCFGLDGDGIEVPLDSSGDVDVDDPNNVK